MTTVTVSRGVQPNIWVVRDEWGRLLSAHQSEDAARRAARAIERRGEWRGKGKPLTVRAQ